MDGLLIYNRSSERRTFIKVISHIKRIFHSNKYIAATYIITKQAKETCLSLNLQNFKKILEIILLGTDNGLYATTPNIAYTMTICMTQSAFLSER